MSISEPTAVLTRREEWLTDEVLRSFDGTADPRLRELMQSLIRHLHSFAREVRVSEKEWSFAIDFLTRTGHMCDERRQEFILLSDVLGLSMMTVGINAPADIDATEPTVFGPFFTQDAPQIEWGGDAAQGAAGEPCWVEGTVTGTEGHPIGGAHIEVWEADEAGQYDVQYDDGRVSGRASLHADGDGRYGFWSVKPVPYPIPFDGPVGQLLAAARRSPMRPAHIHFKVSSPGYQTLVTHVFSRDSEYLDSDAVFGVKASLIVDFEPQTGPAPMHKPTDGSWWRLQFDIKLAKEGAK